MSPPELVIDASVVVKWLVPETDDKFALRLQDQFRDGELKLLAPPLLLLEVGNALWKRVRRGELSSEAAELCFDQLIIDAPELLEKTEVTISALHLALAHKRPIYDCLYLALALDRRCDLITADERFFAAMSPAYSCVRWLRDF